MRLGTRTPLPIRIGSQRALKVQQPAASEAPKIPSNQDRLAESTESSGLPTAPGTRPLPIRIGSQRARKEEGETRSVWVNRFQSGPARKEN